MSSSKHMTERARQLGQTLVACALTVALVATFVTVDGNSATATDGDVYASNVSETAATGDNTIDVETAGGYVYASFTPDETEVYSITVTGDTDLADDENADDENADESDSDDESSSSRNNYVRVILRDDVGDRLARGRGNSSSSESNPKVQYLLESDTTYYLAFCFANYAWGSFDDETTGTISYTIESGTSTTVKKTNKRYTAYNPEGESWIDGGESVWFSFTPSEAADYRFYTLRPWANTSVYVYSSSSTPIASDTSHSGIRKNGSAILKDASADSTYFIQVTNNRAWSSSFKFVVSPVLNMTNAKVSFPEYVGLDSNNEIVFDGSLTKYGCTVSDDDTTFVRARDYTRKYSIPTSFSNGSKTCTVTITGYDGTILTGTYTVTEPDTSASISAGETKSASFSVPSNVYAERVVAYSFTPSVSGCYTLTMTPDSTETYASSERYYFCVFDESDWGDGDGDYEYTYVEDGDSYASDNPHFVAGTKYYLLLCAYSTDEETLGYTFSVSSAPTKTANVSLAVTDSGTLSLVQGSTGTASELSTYMDSLSMYVTNTRTKEKTWVYFCYDADEQATSEIDTSDLEDGTYTLCLYDKSGTYIDVTATITVSGGKVTSVSSVSGTTDAQAASASSGSGSTATKAGSVALKTKKISVKGSWDKKKKNKKTISVAASKYAKLTGIKSATYKLAGGAKGVKVASNGKITLAKGKFKKGKTVTVKVKVTPKTAASGYSLPAAKTLAVKIVLK